MKQRLLTILLTLLPLMASADDSGTCGNGVNYSYVEATHTLAINKTDAGSGNMYNYDNSIFIAPWRSYKNEIHQIVIETGVNSIGNYAFNGCSGLSSVTIPNSVTSIGNSAFQNCNGLSSVFISDVAAWCNIFFYDPFSNPLYYAGHLL